MMTLLALDIGSSSVRAILFENSEAGVSLIPDAIVQRAYRFDTYGDNRCSDEVLQLSDLIDTQALHQQNGIILNTA
jgi:sugar (pentulose or hexulose) kinase